MARTKTVVFDLDGTLADTMGAYSSYAADSIVFAYNVSRVKATMLYFTTAGRPFREQLECMFPRHGFNDLVAEQFENFKVRYQPDVTLFEDAFDACMELSKSGCVLGVVSSTLSNQVHDLIMNSNLSGVIDHITGTARFFHENKYEQLKSFKNQLGNVVFVGDTLYDLEIANEAAVEFIGVEHTISALEFENKGAVVEPSLIRVAERIING